MRRPDRARPGGPARTEYDVESLSTEATVTALLVQAWSDRAGEPAAPTVSYYLTADPTARSPHRIAMLADCEARFDVTGSHDRSRRATRAIVAR